MDVSQDPIFHGSTWNLEKSCEMYSVVTKTCGKAGGNTFFRGKYQLAVAWLGIRWYNTWT